MEERPAYNNSDFMDHMGIWIWLENTKGEIFMLYHKKFGCWTIPLEKSNPDETLDHAIHRTGSEELGIEIDKYDVIHTQEDEYLRDGHLVNVKGFLVKVLEYENEPVNTEPEKHPEFGWKSKQFVKEITNSTDAVIALQKFL